MSSQIYPTLPGIKMDVTFRPVWKTLIKEAVSGRECRTGYMAYPNWEYVISYDFLRSASALAELQTLVGFFNQMRGDYDTFLFAVPEDSSATQTTFGLGDGTTKDFQLVKTFGGFTEPVYNIKASPAPVIRVDGVTKATPADYSINGTGMVSFVNAPAQSAVLDWTGQYYIRVRFKKGSAEFERFMYQLWQLKKVELRGVKGEDS